MDGQLLSAADVNTLPIGSVIRRPNPGGWDVVVRRAKCEFVYVSRYVSRAGHVDPLPAATYSNVSIDGWELLHRGDPEPPRVGDVTDTIEQARALPVGSVIYDEDDADVGTRPAVKIEPDTWLFARGAWNEAETCPDDIAVDQPHRVIYIPDADTGAGSKAA